MPRGFPCARMFSVLRLALKSARDEPLVMSPRGVGVDVGVEHTSTHNPTTQLDAFGAC
jgi:hypothetical protein